MFNLPHILEQGRGVQLKSDGEPIFYNVFKGSNPTLLSYSFRVFLSNNLAKSAKFWLEGQIKSFRGPHLARGP